MFFSQFAFNLCAYDLPVKVECSGIVCNCKRNSDEAVFDTNEIVAYINNGTDADSILIACCYHQIALEYYDFFDDLNSLKYNRKAEEIRSKVNDHLLWRSKLNIGLNYYSLNEYKRAIEYFNKALILAGEKTVIDSITIYSNLADCYMEIGDFSSAIDFAEKSIYIKADQFETNTVKNVFSFILINSKDSFNLIRALKYSEEILQLSQSIKDFENLIVAFNNLSLANRDLNNFDQALIFYKRALEITNNSDTVEIAVLLNNIAIVYREQKKYSLSIETLNKSLTLYNKYFKSKYHFDYSAVLENLADSYTALQQFDTALHHYQKSLINLTNNFRNKDIFKNPNPKDSTLFIYSNPDLIRVLHLKATAAFLFNQQNQNIKYLNLANQTYQTAFDFHDKLQQDISTENSRLFQAKNIVPYIENALKVAYELQENGQDISKAAFRFMEKNKATVLLQAMNEADALQFANLPDSLLEQEKDLKIAITYHNKQLNEAIEYEDTAEIDRLNNLLFDEKQLYSQLINSLEKNHPNYYQLKYKQNQTQLADLQQSLDNETALLEYFVGDSSIYTMLILKGHTQLFKTLKPANWQKLNNNFREVFTLSNREDQFNKYNKKSFKKFVTNANALHQYLLQQPLKELNNISHLKIIPDAELNYIPFDLLLTRSVDTSSVDYKNLPYLIKQKTISYAYSAALMMEQQQSETMKKDFAYGGYAPKYDNSNYSDLPKAREMVNNMATFFKGKKHLNKAATKTSFLNDSLHCQILHLAMHGKLNDQYPLNSHLAFTKTTAKSEEEDYQLYASDLYLHEINANLTILNACETGTGKLRKGEGVMSLSRAFTYAGCPSLLMSLWSIDEKPSADILETFFKKIKKGKPKDEALQQAKLNYLENTPTKFSHPNYWAGLVLTGNTQAMQFQNSLSGVWWVLVLFLILFSGYILIKKA